MEIKKYANLNVLYVHNISYYCNCFHSGNNPVECCNIIEEALNFTFTLHNKGTKTHSFVPQMTNSQQKNSKMHRKKS